MAIQGTFEDLDIPSILQLLHANQKTGTLTLRGAEGKEIRVLFEGGNLVGVDATQLGGRMRLGEMLVSAGIITNDDLGQALQAQKSRHLRLGEILVDLKKVTREELSDLLRLQIYETVFKLYSWKKGEFVFEQGVVEYDRNLISPLETEHILMDSFRMVDEWPIIKKTISAFNLVVNLTEAGKGLRRARSSERGAGNPPPESGLITNGLEEKVFDLIDGKRSVQRLIDLSRLGEFETCKIVVDLVNRGLLSLGPPVQAAPPPQQKWKPKVKISHRTGVFIENASIIITLLAILWFTVGNIIPPEWSQSLGSKGRYPLWKLILNHKMATVSNSIELYYLEKGKYPSSVEELAKEGLLSYVDLRGTGYFLKFKPQEEGKADLVGP